MGTPLHSAQGSDAADGTAALERHVAELCSRARPAAAAMALLPDARKRAALEAAGDELEAAAEAIRAANERDLAAARAERMAPALIERLRLDGKRLDGVIADLRAVATLADPVGAVLARFSIAEGVRAEKVAVPIGVVAIIFESRPNVTIDAAALCLRSGNACILRGGKEAAHSNRALAEAFRRGIANSGAPVDAVQLVLEQDRRLIEILLRRDDAIDLAIPRGGEALIRAVAACSRVPVIRHDKGVCSLYVHAAADPAMAIELVVNAKCQKPGVCNAIENLLVDAAVAPSFLPRLGARMRELGVELRADEAARSLLPGAAAATPEDWTTEYLALILAVKTVAGLDEAIRFTNQHGSHHSDGIVTADAQAAERYLREVDSATVYHNASTRFTDGGQFGFGAEVGISTSRLHARGPMGLPELCTYKYVLRGEGQVRR
jgi:glutamate-5-semialdehyde dehydrogenase